MNTAADVEAIGESVVAPCKAPLRDDYNMVVDSSLTILGSMFIVQMSGIGTRPERDKGKETHQVSRPSQEGDRRKVERKVRKGEAKLVPRFPLPFPF